MDGTASLEDFFVLDSPVVSGLVSARGDWGIGEWGRVCNARNVFYSPVSRCTTIDDFLEDLMATCDMATGDARRYVFF